MAQVAQVSHESKHRKSSSGAEDRLQRRESLQAWQEFRRHHAFFPHFLSFMLPQSPNEFSLCAQQQWLTGFCWSLECWIIDDREIYCLSRSSLWLLLLHVTSLSRRCSTSLSRLEVIIAVDLND